MGTVIEWPDAHKVQAVAMTSFIFNAAAHNGENWPHIITHLVDESKPTRLPLWLVPILFPF